MDPQDPQAADTFTDSDRELSVADAQRYLAWVREAVTRAAQLAEGSNLEDLPSYAVAILSAVIDTLGKSYVDMAIE
ncbi:hypothetical protein V1514DRAFT_319266 [Lipomyces japonicus]|uniref:uncharacterized protein n=1 Tax=Lipomyces japonicus TaxID=56871 RepID=UPI0034CEAFF5